jgi:hypothetical protein
VLILVLVYLILFAALTVILWTGTLGLQGLLYSEPIGGLRWRAPAAASGVTLFLILWSLLDLVALDPNQVEVPYDTIFRFNPTELYQVREFRSVKDNKETVFTRQGAEYIDDNGNRWRRSDTDGIVKAIIVKDPRGEERRFEPQLTRDGKFKPGAEQFPGYYPVKGRGAMLQLGQVSVFRWGLFLANILLNALHLGVWFVCIWLLLRFQWVHALEAAVVLWVAATLIVVPMLLNTTQDVARDRAGIKPTQVLGPNPKHEIRNKLRV